MGIPRPFSPSLHPLPVSPPPRQRGRVHPPTEGSHSVAPPRVCLSPPECFPSSSRSSLRYRGEPPIHPDIHDLPIPSFPCIHASSPTPASFRGRLVCRWMLHRSSRLPGSLVNRSIARQTAAFPWRQRNGLLTAVHDFNVSYYYLKI